jgi:guanosine monophosphate reductase
MKKLIILLFILTSSIVFAQEDTMIFKVYGVAPTDTYEQMEYPYYDAESNSYRAYLISVDNNYYTTAYLSEGEMNFMIIENEVKLDFKDVLFKPMRSTLRSRSEVQLERTFSFKRSSQTWTGVPIMSANMDTVSTFEMAEALMGYKMLAVVHKHYSVKDWKEFISKNDEEMAAEYVVPSIGTSDDDLEKFRKIYELNNFKFLCIDVANGYGEYFPEFIRKVREEFSDVVIIAGNVASGDMTQELILSGADIIKVGLGPGEQDIC